MREFIVEAINDPMVLLATIPAFLIGLNEFLKKMGLDEHWCPLVNFLGGFIAMPFLLSFGANVFSASILCMMVGLSAGGFYDFTKRTILREE